MHFLAKKEEESRAFLAEILRNHAKFLLQNKVSTVSMATILRRCQYFFRYARI
jgi:hypothetical protein